MESKTILVIDANTETAQNIVATLESEDYLVFMSPAAEFAVAIARKVKPALILVNTTISGAGSLDICAKLHEMEELRSVPIIALISFPGEMDPRYRSEYGIVDLLSQPFTGEELTAKVAGALSMRPLDSIQEEGPMTSEHLEEAAGPEEVPVEKTGKSDRIVVRLKEKREETGNVQVSEEGTDASLQPVESREVTEEEREKAFTARKPLRRKGSASTLSPAVIAAALIIILGAAGVIVYKMGIFAGTEAKRPVAVKSAQPAGVQPLPPSPAPEQNPQQEVLRDTPKPPAPVSPPAAASSPSPAHVAEKKGAGKTVYSVQIGAFKSEKNAEALAKQYTEKGYDAFVRTAPKDKEMLHRVLIGKFEARKEAGKLARDIRNRENVQVLVVGD